MRKWAALSIGEGHSAGVSGEGECYTWGQNQHGQLGWAAGEAKDVPMKMDILRGWDVRAIACGYTLMSSDNSCGYRMRTYLQTLWNPQCELSL